LLNDLSFNATFTRTAQGLLADFMATAHLNSECGRCLDKFVQHLSSEFTELYAFNEKSETESGLRVPKSGKIDLAPLIREYLLLDMPINPLCKTDCIGLCPVCGNNRNERLCEHRDDEIDPRLEILKTLLEDED
jgi:uncharacterized protein